MEMTITPGPLSGAVGAQPSKSFAQRLIFCAALAQGESTIDNVGASQDILAAMRVARQTGLASVQIDGNAARVSGGGKVLGGSVADCGESGTVLRLSLPLALNGQAVTFTGSRKLMERPMGIYRELILRRGGVFRQRPGAVEVAHELLGGIYELPGNVSSQFFSGLMLALPLAQRDSVLRATTPIESLPYIEITRQVQRLFGVQCDIRESVIAIPGGQAYRAADAVVEGDWSHAAFFIAAGALGGGVSIAGLNPDSVQADRAFWDILREMGGKADFIGGALRVESAAMRPVTVDVSQCPDLVPALVALACAAQGKTSIVNAARLRIKESDRLSALAREFSALGARIEELPDGLMIYGTGKLMGGRVFCHNDHRIAMALAVASGICEEPVTLEGAECVAKSAPQFFDEFAGLGGICDGR